MSFEQIGVIGLGYIGLPTAAMLASKGIRVIGVDINSEVVETINRGEIHIIEPGLRDLVAEVYARGTLRATQTAEACDAYIIAVPTPFNSHDHSADLAYVEAACASLAPLLKKGDLVILESTSPPGTTEHIERQFRESRPDLKFPTMFSEPDVNIAYCPERVLPGKALTELITNDRVIGGFTKSCSDRATTLYKIFVQGDCVAASDPKTAELTKLAENSFRDVNIAFANELSIICDKLEINVWELIALMNRHPRVNVLQPGPGVGGHCIAVDPWFIVHAVPKEARLIATSRLVNDSKPRWVREKIDQLIQSFMAEQKINEMQSVSVAIYGLTFKADIDDLRDSPALTIAREFVNDHPGKTCIVEPNLVALPTGLDRAEWVQGAASADADIHILLVDHREFKGARPNSRYIFDTRGAW